ncbi:MAG: pentapeptide repeat-containing protein [Anaerolineaceae bacterium]|nr:pentapeptide repeat-containing protein [Anaerolineaceae bacterium]
MTNEIKIEKKASEVIQPESVNEARQAIQTKKDLSGANLEGYSLDNMHATGAILRKTNLQKADLSHGLLISPNFYKTNATGAAVDRTVIVNGDLVKARFTEADLSEGALVGVNAEEANFHGANLRQAGLFGMNLRNADLTQANLANARLAGVNVEGADFSGAEMTGAKAYQVNWDQAKVPPVLMPDPYIQLPKWAWSVIIGSLIGGLAAVIYAFFKRRSTKG